MPTTVPSTSQLRNRTGLERDLAAYLRFYNEERAHTGRLTKGRTPRRLLSQRAR